MRKAALVVGSFFAAFIPLWLSVISYRKEKRDKLFENYHKLIDNLVGTNGEVYIQRQIAIVYEFKRLKKYWALSVKLLNQLKISWTTAL